MKKTILTLLIVFSLTPTAYAHSRPFYSITRQSNYWKATISSELTTTQDGMDDGDAGDNGTPAATEESTPTAEELEPVEESVEEIEP